MLVPIARIIIRYYVVFAEWPVLKARQQESQKSLSLDLLTMTDSDTDKDQYQPGKPTSLRGCLLALLAVPVIILLVVVVIIGRFAWLYGRLPSGEFYAQIHLGMDINEFRELSRETSSVVKEYPCEDGGTVIAVIHQRRLMRHEAELLSTLPDILPCPNAFPYIYAQHVTYFDGEGKLRGYSWDGEDLGTHGEGFPRVRTESTTTSLWTNIPLEKACPTEGFDDAYEPSWSRASAFHARIHLGMDIDEFRELPRKENSIVKEYPCEDGGTVIAVIHQRKLRGSQAELLSTLPDILPCPNAFPYIHEQHVTYFDGEGKLRGYSCDGESPSYGEGFPEKRTKLNTTSVWKDIPLETACP
jgi:hypothetical protein